MTSCCSLPVDEKGFLIEIPEESAQIPARAKNTCPTCGQKGKSVDTATVKSMLSVSLNQIKDTPYFFCQNRDCPTVYFSDDGLQTVTAFDIPSAKYFMPRLRDRRSFWMTSMRALKQDSAPAIGEIRKARAVWVMCAV
jgi:hypothetical protein